MCLQKDNASQKLDHTYRFGHQIAALTVLIWFIAFYFAVYKPNPLNTEARDHYNSGLLDSSGLTITKLVEYRLNHYRSGQDQMQTNLAFQLAFILIGVYVIKGGALENEITVPVFNIKLPTAWLLFIVPSALLYLWLKFGFLLDDMIKDRAAAWDLLSAVGDPIRNEGLRNAAATFHDGGLMDAWFICFRPGEHTIDTTFYVGVAFFLILLYGPMLAGTHACILTILHIANARAKGPGRILHALPWTCFLILSASHFQFKFGGKNPNWMQTVIALFGVSFVYGLLRLSRPQEK